MFRELEKFFSGIVESSIRHPDTIKLTAWGKEREFERYDLFDDTFIFEVGIWRRLENKDPVVLVPKSALSASDASDKSKRRVFGNIMTVSTGNHAVTSLPLLNGKFWDLAAPPEDDRSPILSSRMVCANIVADAFEISQREVCTENVVEMDDWLQALGCTMSRVTLIDREDKTLQHYSRRGQEWRVKPLVWTLPEMQGALRASLCRMHSKIRYYHNVKGVHILTLANFLEWGALARDDYPEFLRGLGELAAKSAETSYPNLLLPKYSDHHEIELFGLPPGFSAAALVPQILELHERAVAGKSSPEDASERFAAIADTFRTALQNPALADENSAEFLENLYRHLTGAVYFGDRDTPAARSFDDQRTALPGATYMRGARFNHDGIDQRTIAILEMIEREVSHGDKIEYANVYELRSSGEETRLGEGRTREVIYKTDWNPLPVSIIEKRLEQKSTGYGIYTIARVQAFRCLGIAFGMHRLLARADGCAGDTHFFIRNRYPGEPFDTLPDYRFRASDPLSGKYDAGSEAPDIVRGLITLMGGAAAENMILKKFVAGSIRFAEGKEIVEFGYDVLRAKEMPITIRLCSVKGTLGWPDLGETEENIAAMFVFYMTRYAATAFAYSRKHPAEDPRAIADSFFAGFSSRTREIAWNYTKRRDQFDVFKPRTFDDFKFHAKWKFALWALEIQRDRLAKLGDIFHAEFAALCEKS